MNKVYVVMKGYDYEGYTDTDMKVFINKKDAEVYAKILEQNYCDYVHIIEQEIQVKNITND